MAVCRYRVQLYQLIWRRLEASNAPQICPKERKRPLTIGGCFEWDDETPYGGVRRSLDGQIEGMLGRRSNAMCDNMAFALRRGL